MNILYYLLKRKFVTLFDLQRNTTDFVIFIIIVSLTCYSSFNASTFLNKIIQNKIILASDFIYYNFIFLTILSAALIFFPVYRRKILLFRNTDPLSKVNKIFVELFYNFFSRNYFILAILIICNFIIIERISFLNFFYLFSYLFASSILNLILKTSLQNGFPKYLRIIIFASFFCLLYLATKAKVDPIFSLFTIPLYTIVYYLLHTVFLNENIKVKNTNINVSRNIQIFTQIYFRNSLVKITYLIAILFKTIFLLIFLSKSDTDIFASYFKYLLLSNLLLFTYINNNLWGYLKTSYYVVSERKDIILLFKTYVYLITCSIFFDFLLSSIFVLKYDINYLSFIVFYTLSTFSNILIGSYSSLKDPKEVERVINFESFKSNTPILFNILSISILLINIFLFNNKYWLILCIAEFTMLSYSTYYFVVKGKICKNLNNIYNRF